MFVKKVYNFQVDQFWSVQVGVVETSDHLMLKQRIAIFVSSHHGRPEGVLRTVLCLDYKVRTGDLFCEGELVLPAQRVEKRQCPPPVSGEDKPGCIFKRTSSSLHELLSTLANKDRLNWTTSHVTRWLKQPLHSRLLVRVDPTSLFSFTPTLLT